MVDSAEPVLRLTDAGDAKPAWVTLLTTEHYNLQTQRAATISETNGRASIFMGAVSAGLIALGFQSSGTASSGGATAFAAVVLTSLVFLGFTTFVRALETSIDDWQFALRIDRLREVYAQLVPELAPLLAVAAGAEQSTLMLAPGRVRLQSLLTVAGTVGTISSVLVGADVGVLVFGPTGNLWLALGAGAAAGLLCLLACQRFQNARWNGANEHAP